MKKYIFFSLILNVILISYIGYQHITIRQQPSQENRTSKEIKRIAVFTPATHPSLEAIEQGFINTLQKETSTTFEFTTFNANGSRTLMRSQAEEIVQANYDLIFTIGAQATQIAKEITEKKQQLIPIVFGAVAEPQKLHLIKEYNSSQNHLTGVTEDRDLAQQLEVLRYLKPSIRSLMLVYNPTQGAGLERQKQEIEQLCKKSSLSLTSIEVYQPNEIYHKVASLITSTDAVLVLKDNTVVSAIDSLVKLCNQHNTLLYVSDLDSVNKGAVLGFGVYEQEFGIESAHKAKQILIDKKNPSHIPVTQAINFKVKVNKKAMEKQGLLLDRMQLFLIEAGEAIAD